MNERLEGIISAKVTTSVPVAIGAGILTLGAGVAIGFILGRLPGRPKPLSEEDQAEVTRIQEDMAKMKAERDIPRVDLSPLRDEKSDHVEPPSAGQIVIDEAAYKKARKRGAKIVPQEPEVTEPVTENNSVVRRNVFAAQSDPEDDWDYEKEQASRNSTNPYVIHEDEFFEESDEFPYIQRQLTWYNGDGVLVDERTDPVYNHREVVGDMKFGHGSKDPNLVYIRNERLKAEYMISLDEGRYDVEVQGVDPEDVNDGLRHSNATRRFRTE